MLCASSRVSVLHAVSQYSAVRWTQETWAGATNCPQKPWDAPSSTVPYLVFHFARSTDFLSLSFSEVACDPEGALKLPLCLHGDCQPTLNPSPGIHCGHREAVTVREVCKQEAGAKYRPSIYTQGLKCSGSHSSTLTILQTDA